MLLRWYWPDMGGKFLSSLVSLLSVSMASDVSSGYFARSVCRYRQNGVDGEYMVYTNDTRWSRTGFSRTLARRFAARRHYTYIVRPRTSLVRDYYPRRVFAGGSCLGKGQGQRALKHNIIPNVPIGNLGTGIYHLYPTRHMGIYIYYEQRITFRWLPYHDIRILYCIYGLCKSRDLPIKFKCYNYTGVRWIV